MDATIQVWGILFLVFVTVTSAVIVVGLQLDKRRRVQTRLVGEGGFADESTSRIRTPLSGVYSNVIENLARRIDDRVLVGHGAARRSKLRAELTLAGFFSPNAPKVYFFVQAMATIAMPWIGYLVFVTYSIDAGDMEPLYLVGLAGLGYVAPMLYVERRKAALAGVYRAVFPDFLDLLVVCVDAGLSLNAALERVSREFSTQCPPLADNLAIFLSEIRSGRSIVDGLENLSARLGIAEARALSTLIKQSMELGSDVGQATRVYSDDMRVKRLLRAETLAAKLPVKMLIPLGLCIFPVILIVIITPALIKVFDVMNQVSGS